MFPTLLRASLVPALVLVLAGTGLAAEYQEEAGPDPRIAQLRMQMERLTDKHAADLIAEQESPRQQADVALVLGAFMLMGNIGEADPLKAFEYFRQASELGCPEADVALANLYNTGVETDEGRIARDAGRAREYFEKAAEAGSTAALLELGEIYNDGKNVDPDSKKALQYYMKAAERGEPTALVRLEPVMRNAREWEAARPGRKANFPTSREDIVDEELVRQDKARNAALDRLASKMYIELNKRVAKSAVPPERK